MPRKKLEPPAGWVLILRNGPDGVKKWNRLTVAVRALMDLSRADLRGCDLSGIYLPGLTADGASFANANLTNARLKGSFNEASFAGASADSAHVFFHTTESLSPADTDIGLDVYDRFGGTTTLVTAGGTTSQYAFFGGASKDGARVFFYTDEQLVSADTDPWYDVYERYGGQTTLISTGPTSTSGDNNAFYDGASDNGTKVFFETDESPPNRDRHIPSLRIMTVFLPGASSASVNSRPSAGPTPIVRKKGDVTRMI